MRNPSLTAASTPQPFVFLWLCLLMAVGAYLRVKGVNTYYYSSDEAMEMRIAQGGDLREVFHFALYGVHPPLGALLRHAWLFFSQDIAYARGMQLVFGLSLIPLYYRLGARIGNPASGLCAATIITFSHGCIIQSYLVRNYALFLLLLSLCYDTYVRLNDRERVRDLILYTLLACLAELTHFSGIFCIASISAYRTLQLWKAGDKKALARWMLANAVPLVLTAALYHAWQPTLQWNKPYFDSFHLYSIPMILLFTLLYPMAVATYLFPGNIAALFLSLLGIAALFFLRRMSDDRMCRAQALAGLAMLLAMGMFATGIYTMAGTRHSLWLFPLVIPILSVSFTEALVHMDSFKAALRSLHIREMPVFLLAPLFLIAGYVMYSPAERFADTTDYQARQTEWDSAMAYMNGLSPKDLLVMQLDDAVLLSNPYPYLGDIPFTASSQAITLPFGHTNILSNPYYRRMRLGTMMFGMYKEAAARHLLDGVDRLVFFYSFWPQSFVADLIRCEPLDKQIVSFPAHAAGYHFSKEAIQHTDVILLIVSRQDFESDVMNPYGKARACLKSEHDAEAGSAPR